MPAAAVCLAPESRKCSLCVAPAGTPVILAKGHMRLPLLSVSVMVLATCSLPLSPIWEHGVRSQQRLSPSKYKRLRGWGGDKNTCTSAGGGRSHPCGFSFPCPDCPCRDAARGRNQAIFDTAVVFNATALTGQRKVGGGDGAAACLGNVSKGKRMTEDSVPAEGGRVGKKDTAAEEGVEGRQDPWRTWQDQKWPLDLNGILALYHSMNETLALEMGEYQLSSVVKILTSVVGALARIMHACVQVRSLTRKPTHASTHV